MSSKKLLKLTIHYFQTNRQILIFNLRDYLEKTQKVNFTQLKTTLMKRLVLIILFLGSLQIGHGQNSSNLELVDIFNMEYVSDPQISPDGSQVLYVRNFKDVMTDKNLSNIWLINSDGSKNRPITTGNQNDNYPRWSHDGQKIIFKSNREDERMKLYLMWIDTKEMAPLTNTPKAPGHISWSPDARSLAFSFTGLVIGSLVYSLPFVLQPLKNAFAAIESRQLDMAAVSGARPMDRFFSLVIPQARQGYATAAILGIAHTLGEFGVVLMIGGSLAGETRVASVALYEHVEAGDYANAHRLAAVLLVASVLMLSG